MKRVYVKKVHESNSIIAALIMILFVYCITWYSGGVSKVYAEDMVISATFTKGGDSCTLIGIDDDDAGKKSQYIKVVPQKSGTYKIYPANDSAYVCAYVGQVNDDKYIGGGNNGVGCTLVLNAGTTYYVEVGFNYQGGKGDITVNMEEASGFRITAYDVVDGKNVAKIITDGDSVPGLKWDMTTNTLTMDGYNGGGLEMDCIVNNMLVDANIVISGNNVIDLSKGNADYIGITSNTGCNITGTGILDVKGSDDSCVGMDAPGITIDGPTIRLENVIYGAVAYGDFPNGQDDENDPNGIVIKSGTFIMDLVPRKKTTDDSADSVSFTYGSAFWSASDIDITGGNYYINYIYDETVHTTVDIVTDYGTGVFVNERGILSVSDNSNIYVCADEKLDVIPTFKCLYAEDDDSVNKVDVDESSVTVDRRKVTVQGTSGVFDIGTASVKLSESLFIYDGKEKKPEVTVSGLAEGTDYSIAYSNNINAGTAAVNVTGKGRFTGTNVVNYTIDKADIGNAGVSLSQTSFEYDGTSKMPKVSVAGLNEDKDYTVAYANNVYVGTASVTITGIGNYKGTKTVEYTITGTDNTGKETSDGGAAGNGDEAKTGETTGGAKTGPAVGTIINYGGYQYKVKVSAVVGDSSGEVTVIGATSKKIKKIDILDTVNIDGFSYNITSIGDKAFAKYKKLTGVTIGSNVKTIGKQAFYKCTKLKKVTMGKSVTSIGKEAFAGCSKLSAVNIKATGLKTIGKKAFKGIYKKAVFKLPKLKLKAYTKLIKKVAAGKNIKYKKL